jgi:hypothetical protein
VKEQKRIGGLSVGSSSILVVFVALSLTIFAALSFMSARADLRLAEKQAQSTLEYYAADEAATLRLAALDAVLRPLGPPGAARGTSYAAAAAGALSGLEGLELELEPELGPPGSPAPQSLRLVFDEPVNERQVLRVELRLPAPAPARWRITAWRIVNVREWEGGQNTIEVWRPE